MSIRTLSADTRLLEHFPALTAIKSSLLLAICLLAIATAAQSRRFPRNARIAGLIPACGALLVGLYSLLRSISGEPFQWDVSARATSSFLQSGRMSTSAAIAVVMLSVSLCLSYKRGLLRASQLLAFGSSALCAVNLIANVYGVKHLYAPHEFISMSVGASLSVLLMSFAVLTVRPRAGLLVVLRSNTPGGKIVRRLIPPIVLIPAILGTLLLKGQFNNFDDIHLGVALLVVSTIAIFTVLIWFSARWINRIDHSRSTTQFRLAQLELQQRSVLDALPLLVWTCLPSGECDFVNQRFVDYTGEPAASQLGYGWSRFVHPEDLNRVKQTWSRSIETGLAVNAEYRILSPALGYRWFAAHASAIRDASGTIVKWFGSSMDIDDLKVAETQIRSLNSRLEHRIAARTAELHQANTNLQSVLDSATQVAIIATDISGVIRIFSLGAEFMTGYRADEIVGKHSPLVLHDKAEVAERAAELSEYLCEPIHSSQVFSLYPSRGFPDSRRWTYIRKDGVRRTVQLAVTSFLSSSGEITGYLGIATDITNRISLEQSLLQQNASLAKSKLEVEAANRAKGEFLATMSHEIRTPMNGIMGMTGLLLDSTLTPEQNRFAETIRANGESLLAIINEILDFSKIEAGKMDLEVIDFKLRTMIESAVQILATRAHEKGLQLSTQIDASIPEFVAGDPGRLRQILLNLIGNAIKFTPQGSVSLAVSPDPSKPHCLRFTVRDTGIGISADRQAHIFQPFTQADSSASRKYGGTGLGLAISKDLAHLMGGRMGLSSIEGEGSTFWFTAVLPPAASGLAQLASVVSNDLTGTRVLIADASKVDRLVLSTLLSNWGCIVEQAASATAALDLLRASATLNSPFDIAMIDFLLPGANGFEFPSLIADDSSRKRCPLILMTSITERGQAKSSELAGFAAYLTKPVRPEDLRSALEILVHQRLDPGSPILTRHSLSEIRDRKGRILLAEDNTTNQIVAVEVLTRLGYRVDVAANGSEAIHALLSAPYDLVLMDCQMPEMDGYAATQRIRSGQTGVSNPDIPIVAMTANALSGDREKCLAAGMNDYIAKPMRPKQLIQVLEKYMPARVANTLSCQ